MEACSQLHGLTTFTTMGKVPKTQRNEEYEWRRI